MPPPLPTLDDFRAIIDSDELGAPTDLAGKFAVIDDHRVRIRPLPVATALR
jgi:hypothetical protein